MSKLPEHIPEGMKRYRATAKDQKDNPFNPHGVPVHTQTVDVEEAASVEQVVTWARECAQQSGYELVDLSIIGPDGTAQSCAL